MEMYPEQDDLANQQGTMRRKRPSRFSAVISQDQPHQDASQFSSNNQAQQQFPPQQPFLLQQQQIPFDQQLAQQQSLPNFQNATIVNQQPIRTQQSLLHQPQQLQNTQLNQQQQMLYFQQQQQKQMIYSNAQQPMQLQQQYIGLPQQQIQQQQQQQQPQTSLISQLMMQQPNLLQPVILQQQAIQYQNPEDVPVGIMCDMLIKQKQNAKLLGTSVSYTPLDPTTTPQQAPLKPIYNDSVRIKTDQFYRFVADTKDDERRERKRQDRIKIREEQDRQLLMQQQRKSDRDIEKELTDLYGPTGRPNESQSNLQVVQGGGLHQIQQQVAQSPNVISKFHQEMGVGADGQLLNANQLERGGLGNADANKDKIILTSAAQAYSQLRQNEDVLSNFRKQRSYQYHTSAEERQSTRGAPDVCYVCQMPGHIAKNCKFGLS